MSKNLVSVFFFSFQGETTYKNKLYRTQKEVIRVRRIPSDLEDLDQIIELAVYVTYDRDRSSNMHDITLHHKELLCFGTYCFDDRVGEELFAIETGNAGVEIDRCYGVTGSQVVSHSL
jgi:hypothetical protein